MYKSSMARQWSVIFKEARDLFVFSSEALFSPGHPLVGMAMAGVCTELTEVLKTENIKPSELCD